MSREKSHFWVGKFESEALYFDFVAEDDSRYELEDYDDIPVSKFAASQGEVWIDHDFMESGFEPNQVSLKKQFAPYSYAYDWGAELEKRCANLKLEGANTLIFLNEGQISNPVSVDGPGFKLVYVGVIAYEI